MAGHGPFNSEIHGQQFFSEAQRFFDYLQQKLQVPKDRMLQVVRDKRLVSKSLTFSLPELDVLDLLDQNMGLSKLEYRDTVQPTRLSSLFHCRTIFNLLLFSGKNIRNHQKRQQCSIYRKQLVLAARFNKTVVIHSREAGNDCFTIAKEELLKFMCIVSCRAGKICCCGFAGSRMP